MKVQTKTRILSLLLCLSMIFTLMPTWASAAVGDTVVQPTETVSSINQLSTDFSGLVVSKADDGDYIKLTFGLRNVPSSSLYRIDFRWDPTVVDLYKTNKSGAIQYNTFAKDVTPADKKLIFDYSPAPDGIVVSAAVDAGMTIEHLFDDNYGPFALDPTKTTTLTLENADNKLTGDMTLVFETKEGAMSGMFEGAEDNGSNIKIPSYPTNAVMNLFSMYFKVKEGQTVTNKTFALLNATGNETGFYGSEGIANEYTAKKTAFVNFPEPEPEYGSITVTAPYAGVTVSLDDGKETRMIHTGTTDSSLTARIENVPVGTYTYTLSGTPKDVSGNVYKVKTGSETGSVTVTKETPATVNIEASAFEKVSYAFPLTVNVTDMKGTSKTGGTITVGAASLTNGTQGTVAATGVLDVAVSGVDGYQDRTVQVQLTPKAGSFEEIESLTVLSAYANYATASVTDGAGEITVKLSETAADVVLPLPMPDPSGDDALNTTDTPVESIKAQLTPKTEKAKQELGAANVTLSAPDDIEVTVADGKITGITVKANLPAGAYDVVITGTNMKTLYTTLNIVKKSDGGYVANVGGDAELDNGEIKQVTGGATATDTGNGKVDFGNTVNDGATVGSDGTVTGGTPITGGIKDAPSIKDELTPTTLTGPVYVVDMRYDKTDLNNPYVEATVSLKNVDASISAGTFGIQYDAAMFTAMSGKGISDVVTLAGGIGYSAAEPQQVVYPTGNTNEPGYIVFGWTREPSDTTWQPGDTIFTIKLYGDASLETFVNNGAFCTETVTVMPFTDTAVGKQAVADGDGAYVEQVWRTLGTDGSTVVKLEDAAAIKGGFYQINQDNDDRNVQHDVRMEFKLPEIENIKLSVPFRVQTGKNGTFVDIPGATVTLYKDSATFATDFAAGTAEALATVKTNSNGNANFGVEPGTYHYTVTHGSYWAYPDGTTDTDKANDYDTFEIAEDGTITLANSSKEHWATLNAAKEINPLMDAKSFHIVKLDSAGMSAIPAPRISSNNMAYNQQDYYFSIEPAAGYEWKESDMATVAAALVTAGAVRFENVDATATTEDGMYASGSSAAITSLSWDAARGQFKIAAAAVVGDSVGEDVDASVKTQVWYSPLRSGDIKITVTDDMFQPKEMVITATAGNGGKVTAREPDPARTEGSSSYTADGTAGVLPITAGNDEIVETLNGGRTDSAVFNFKPDDTNDGPTKQTIIDKVIVNGVELPLTDAQKKDPNGYDYQFINVTGDESITVTFATIDPTDPDKPPVPESDPVITLVVGEHGKVTHGSDDYAGLINTTVTAAAGADFVVVIEATPAADYQIDKVYLDDNLVTGDLTATTLGGANSDQPTKGTLTIPAADMGKGASHSIVVTFKPLDSAESTEIVVVSSVKQDTLGTISPVGRNVYPVNYTPNYVMKPYDSLWELKYGYEDDNTTPKTGAVEVTVGTGAPADKTVDVTYNTTSSLYEYTMEPLTEDSTLVVAFNEVGHVVHGYVQIVATALTAKEATLVFERDESDTSLVRTPVTCQTEKTVTTQSGGVKVLAFTAVVPQGMWNVTVSKSGYLNCEISKFEVKTTDGEIWFGGTSESDVHNIILIPGDASQDAKNVGFADVGVVAAGWAGPGAKLANRINGDLDESEYGKQDGQRISTSNDMQFVISNYRRVASLSNKKYLDFCASGNAIT